MVPVENTSVRIEATPVVDLDCALYSISETQFALLIENLRKDPFLGHRISESWFEYVMKDHSVSYFVTVEPQITYVLLSGIRPVETIAKTTQIVNLADKAISVLKRIQQVAGLF